MSSGWKRWARAALCAWSDATKSSAVMWLLVRSHASEKLARRKGFSLIKLNVAGMCSKPIWCSWHLHVTGLPSLRHLVQSRPLVFIVDSWVWPTACDVSINTYFYQSIRKKGRKRCRVREGKEREEEEKERNIFVFQYPLFFLDHKSTIFVFSHSFNIQARTSSY